MTPALITAVCTGVTGILGAVTALVIALRHQNDPDAHGGAGHDQGNQ